jgi:tyrosyl-tRNA synthetase
MSAMAAAFPESGPGGLQAQCRWLRQPRRSLRQIRRLSALQGSEINDAKKILATEATALVHTREDAIEAAEASRLTFEEGIASDDLPTIRMPKSDFAEGLGVVDAFMHSGLVNSKFGSHASDQGQGPSRSTTGWWTTRRRCSRTTRFRTAWSSCRSGEKRTSCSLLRAV